VGIRRTEKAAVVTRNIFLFVVYVTKTGAQWFHFTGRNFPPTEQGDMWFPAMGWTWWKREKSFLN
jgi:hypothetical protein